MGRALLIIFLLTLSPDALAAKRLRGSCLNWLSPVVLDEPVGPSAHSKLENRPSPLDSLDEAPSILNAKDLSPGGSIWRRWMSRDFGEKTNIVYLKNAKKALEEFDIWFRKGKLSDFEKMLDRMNLISSIGDPQNATLYTAALRESTYSSGDYVPGLSRYTARNKTPEWFTSSFKKRTFPSFAFHTLDDLLNGASKGKGIGKAFGGGLAKFQLPAEVNWASFKAKNPDTLEVTRKGKTYTISMRRYGKGTYSYWPVRVRGIETNNQHSWNELDNEGKKIFHRGPQSWLLGAYLREGKLLMKDIRAFPLRLGSKEDEFFEVLSDYYHLMLNAHLYYRVNNSMLMNQVNYILRIHGYRPVTHFDLDYFANTVDYDQFQVFFRDHVMDFQDP